MVNEKEKGLRAERQTQILMRPCGANTKSRKSDKHRSGKIQLQICPLEVGDSAAV